MIKRKYTHIKIHEAEIIAMRDSGMTRQQIADALGLEKSQIKNWITRHNRTQKGNASAPADDYAREIERLKLENERLRSILQSASKQ